MEEEQDNRARKEWLNRTLYALRGHFRDGPPPAKADLRREPSGKEGIIFHCSDGRQMEALDLQLGRGQYYDATRLGVAIPPFNAAQSNPAQDETIACLRRGLLNGASAEHDTPKACIIVGHETCGANNTLLQAQLPRAAPEAPEEAALMRPMASDVLGVTLRNAHGVDRGFLHERVSESTVLSSMKNVYGYSVGGAPVEALVDSGRAQIIGAMRGLEQKDGQYPLSVYDPDKHDFVRIEKLYDEAFPGNTKRRAEDIEERMERTGQTVFALPPQPSVQAGFIGGVNAGLSAQLAKIRNAATFASWVNVG